MRHLFCTLRHQGTLKLCIRTCDDELRMSLEGASLSNKKGSSSLSNLYNNYFGTLWVGNWKRLEERNGDRTEEELMKESIKLRNVGKWILMMNWTMPSANLTNSTKPLYCIYGAYFATNLCRLEGTLWNAKTSCIQHPNKCLDAWEDKMWIVCYYMFLGQDAFFPL